MSARPSVRSPTSTASGNLCPFDGAGSFDDFPEYRVGGVMIAPGDVTADHPRLLPVTAVIGVVEGEVAQTGELGLDTVQPGTVIRNVGEFDVVGRRPGPDPTAGPGGPVRSEVAQDDRDPYLGGGCNERR